MSAASNPKRLGIVDHACNGIRLHGLFGLVVVTLMLLAASNPLWANKPADQAPEALSMPAGQGAGQEQGAAQSQEEPEDDEGQDDDIVTEQEDDEAMAQHLDGTGEGVVDSGNILQGLESEYMENEEASGSGSEASPAAK